MANGDEGAYAAMSADAQRFQAAVAAITDALWTNDADGKMIGEQPGWAKLTGQSFEEYQGYGWADAVHPDDAQPTIDAWEKAVAARATFNFEHRIMAKDRKWRLYAIRAVPVLNEDGSIREWVGVHRDITESTEARLQLARNAETFEALVRNNPFGIFVIDHDFKMLHISEGTRKVFAGVDPLSGRDFAEILGIVWQEPRVSESIGRFRYTLETGQPYASNNTVAPRNDLITVETYDWRIERIVLPDGNFGVVCYFYDLSERVALEDSLNKALDDKDILVREIDHRVRNSLMIVSSLLSMQSGSSPSDEVKQALETAAKRLLAVARIHERLYKGSQLGIVQFDDYLRQICTDLSASLARDGVVLQVKTVPVGLAVDHAVPLGLITNELVTNAFKHCKGDHITIRVELEHAADGYMLTVSDNGAGMPDDFVDGSGQGLGMQVVSLLAEQIGSRMVMPSAGEAALFKVPIPATVAAAPAAD